MSASVDLTKHGVARSDCWRALQFDARHRQGQDSECGSCLSPAAAPTEPTPRAVVALFCDRWHPLSSAKLQVRCRHHSQGALRAMLIVSSSGLLPQGFLHVSELEVGRAEDPSARWKEGDSLDVMCTGFDRGKRASAGALSWCHHMPTELQLALSVTHDPPPIGPAVMRGPR